MKVPIRILHLEDNDNDAELVQTSLETAGMECHFTRATSKANFEEALKNSTFDLICADVSLPGFNGVSALKITKEIAPHTPFLFVSGTIGEEQAIQMLKDGATDYILKGRLSGLPQAVSRALRESEERIARVRAEESLRHSEQKYRSLVSNIPGVFWSASQERKISYVSPYVTEILGFQPEEIYTLQIAWNERIHPDDRAFVEDAYSQLFSNGVVYDVRYRIQKNSGEWVWLHDRAAIIHEAGVKQAYGFFTDITTQKKTEWILSLQYEITRILAEVPELKDATSLILQTICENFEWEIGEIWLLNHSSQSFRKLSSWNQSESELAQFEQFSDAEEISSEHLQGSILRENRWLWIADIRHEPKFLRTKAATVANLHGFVGFPLVLHNDALGVIQFLSKEMRRLDDELVRLMHRSAGQVSQFIKRKLLEQTGKELEAQLRQAQKIEAVGQLAGGIAHDFNNILMAISGYCELLEMKVRSNPSIAGDVKEISNAATRGAALTRQLLTFSRKQIVERKPININRIVLGLEQMLRRLISEETEIVFELASNIDSLEADTGQIEQVIMNLVVNARDAISRNGKITIHTSNETVTSELTALQPQLKPGNYVLLKISDNGHGMSEDVKTKLFEPFFTTKAEGKGTGLGLSTVYGIVKQTGGHISVTSELGKGSSFMIYFPQTTREWIEPERVANDSVETDSHTKETVLLVDDNQTLRNAVSAFLELKGYRILQASNGNQALALSRSHPGYIDVLITDIAMPFMDGSQLAELLLVERPGIKIFLMSGYTGDLIARNGGLLAKAKLLQKPISFEALHRKIRETLEGQ